MSAVLDYVRFYINNSPVRSSQPGLNQRRKASLPFRLRPQLVTIDTIDKSQQCCVLM